MVTLHDPTTHAALRARVESLRPDAARRWGRMSVDQMLWHLNGALAMALGEVTAAPVRAPLPKPLMRLLALDMPWPRNVPTVPELLPRSAHDFDAERDRCLALLDRVAAHPIDGAWPTHPALGTIDGTDWSALQAKHVAHHLDQFGA